MKRLIPVITLLALILMTSTAFAQYRDGAVLLTLDAGGSMSKSTYSGDSLNGTAAGFAIDKVLGDGKFTFGGSLTWLRTEETVVIEDDKTGDVTYSSTPFRLNGRWNFLNGKFAANIGVGLGIHTSTVKLYEGTIDERSGTTSALNIGLPITIAYFLDPDFYLTAIYSPNWMSSSYTEDDFAQAVMFGLGFQWGAETN
jgi:hypothetical protein